MTSRWLVVVLVALLVLVEATAAWSGMDPQPVLLAALVVAVGAAGWALSRLHHSAAPAISWPQSQPAAEAHRMDWQVAALRTRVAFDGTERDSSHRLRAALEALVDDRLMAAHGVDRHTDPQAARAILGDDLSRFIGDGGGDRSRWRRRDLERIIASIEAL